jgi:hypothetical protein
MNNKIYYIGVGIFIFLLLLSIFYYNKNIDNFDNLESNLFTYDSCCNQEDIKHCETYGKTGVCNYILNNNSCLCQNSF